MTMSCLCLADPHESDEFPYLGRRMHSIQLHAWAACESTVAHTVCTANQRHARSYCTSTIDEEEHSNYLLFKYDCAKHECRTK